MAQPGAAQDAGQGHQHGHGYDGQGGQHHGQGQGQGREKKGRTSFLDAKPGVQKTGGAVHHLSHIIPLRPWGKVGTHLGEK